MKRRNPFFVAAFPYTLMLIGYIALSVMDATRENAEEFSNAQGIAFLVFIGLVFVGAAYTLYWMVITARALRRITPASIPNALLLAIPLANYWWMWRYSQAAEIYIKEKYQAALIFLLIAALGSIGLGILQDSYNKTMEAGDPSGTPPQPTL